MECQAPGFAPQMAGEVRLETGQTARLDFELKPGAVSQSVEVSAAAVLLNSETSEVGQVIDSKRILEMPLNGRNYVQLAQFTAGVLPGGNSGTGSRARDEGAFASAGSHVAQNNVLLDGNDNSSRSGGGPLGYESQQVKPPVDAVAEFKVVTNNLSAEYGYRAGAKVLVTTKSGGNEFHGSAYEFLRNERLDGTNFFANRSGAAKPTYRQNQFGATLGGPVIRNRTFFFGSYQDTRIRTGQSYLGTVASRDIVERGDFSKQPATRRNVFDPLTTTGTGAAARRQPFPNNVIPLNRWDPVAKNLIPLYPAANVPGVSEHDPSNYYYSPSDANDAGQYDARVDHNFSEKHRFFARYSLRDQFRDEKGYLPFPAMGGWGQTVKLLAHNIASSLTSSLTPVVYNELRFGYSKFDTAFDIPFTENMNNAFGIRNAPGDSMNDGKDHGYSLINPSGFAQLGPRASWPNNNNFNNWMITEGLLWQRGKHTLKFGGELRHSALYRDAARFRRGRFNFNGQFTSEFPNVGSSRSSTGNGLADMLLGYVSGGNYSNSQGEDYRTRYFGFYVQDDWKLTPRLTLNLGLRYEVFCLGTYPDPDKQQSSRYLLAGINVPTVAEEKFVFPTSSSDAGGHADKNNFAPRVGLAWSVTGKTVVRAGAGMFYGEGNATNEVSNFRTGAPRQIEVAIQTTPVATNYYLKDGFPTLVTGIVPSGVDASVFPPTRPTLYVSQWFLDLQRTLPWETLLTVGYLGTKGTHLHGTARHQPTAYAGTRRCSQPAPRAAPIQ